MLSSYDDYKKRRRRAALSAVGLFLIGALFGAYIMLELPMGLDLLGLRAQQEQEEPKETPESVSADTPREAVVAEGAEAEWLVRFEGCDHVVKVNAPGPVAGMTRKQLAIAYPDYAIEIFDVEFVRLARPIEGYCPEHYTLKRGEDTALIITRTDIGTLSQKEIMRILVDLTAIDDEALEALDAGVTFGSLEEINSYLEGAE